MYWYLKVLGNYTNFEGRARRKEYWFFVLINMIFTAVCSLLDQSIGTFNYETNTGTISSIYSLLVLIPSVAVAVRRLHDTNRRGWWLLLIFVPIAGWIILFVFLVLKGEEKMNRFGLSPLNSATD